MENEWLTPAYLSLLTGQDRWECQSAMEDMVSKGILEVRPRRPHEDATPYHDGTFEYKLVGEKRWLS